jgi:diadenosine tetraphosphate (Ap4A) HIT family hydrolase
MYWDVVHAYNTALPGWLVLVVRRHITAVAEMTDAEAAELGNLLRRVSLALQKVTGCSKTYVVQFAEQAEHPHVHFHVIPRMVDQPDEYKSTRIFNLLGVPPSERITEEQMNEIAQRIQLAMSFL